MTNIFAIVVTYNGAKWVDRCFGSLCRSSIPMRILAIDNASADDTVSQIRERFPQVETIPAGGNLGFGRASNIGLQKALSEKASHVLLLNQDAWIEADTIKTLLNIAEAQKRYGILSPFHMDVSGRHLERQFQDFLSVGIAGSFASDAYLGNLQPVYKTEYVHAACWLLSYDCIKTVGGFDPLFFHYGEDDDYMSRAKYFSFDIGIVPAARVTHDSNYKGWADIEWNENRNRVIMYKELKKMSPHFRSGLLAFVKSELDKSTGYLIFRKFKKFVFHFKMFWKVMFRLKKIHASYKASFNKGAFLYHE